MADNEELKYKYLNDWDKQMIRVIKENHVLSSGPAQQIFMDGSNKVIIFERNNLLFIFNFSVDFSIFGYEFPVPHAGTYRILLNSDNGEFGGFNRIDNSINYATDDNQRLSIYLTNRTALVMKRT